MDLSLLINDIGWTFLLPLICLLSLIANLINISVLFKLRRHKNNTYNYIFLKSITNSIYLFFCFFVFIFRCGIFCNNLKHLYITKFYQLYIFNYLTSCFGMYDLLIELLITITRFLTLLRNTQMTRSISNLVLFGSLLISFLFYLPNLFCFQIIQDDEINNRYKIKIISNKSLNVIQILDTAGISVRGLLIIFLMVFINLLSFLKFNQNISIVYNNTVREINPSNRYFIFHII